MSTQSNPVKKQLGLFKTTTKAVKDVVRESGVALSSVAITGSASIGVIQSEVQSFAKKRSFDLKVGESKAQAIHTKIEVELKKLEDGELTDDVIEAIFDRIETLQDKIALFG